MKNKFNLLSGLVLLMLFTLVSCTEQTVVDTVQLDSPEPRFVDLSRYTSHLNGRSDGENYAILMAEFITIGEEEEMGNTVFFRELGNKQLAGDFVPVLSALTDGTPDISYYIDESRPSADVGVDISSAAIDRAMTTWDEVTCSEIGIHRIPYDGTPAGFVAEAIGFGGGMDFVADVVHAGWMPADFFEFFVPGGGAYIIAGTFTIIFLDSDSNPVDIDNNGKYDVAWREIYYSDEFQWQDGDHIDIETDFQGAVGCGLAKPASYNKEGKLSCR